MESAFAKLDVKHQGSMAACRNCAKNMGEYFPPPLI